MFRDGKAEGDPLVTWFRSAAHEAGLSQKAAATLFAGYMDQVLKIAPAPLKLDDEIKALGDKGKTIHDSLTAKGKHMMDAGVFSAADFADYQMVIGAREGMMWMGKLFDALGDRTIPATSDRAVNEELSEQKLYQMVKDPRYNSDPAFRDDVNQKFREYFGDEPAGSSRRGLSM